MPIFLYRFSTAELDRRLPRLVGKPEYPRRYHSYPQQHDADKHPLEHTVQVIDTCDFADTDPQHKSSQGRQTREQRVAAVGSPSRVFIDSTGHKKNAGDGREESSHSCQVVHCAGRCLEFTAGVTR